MQTAENIQKINVLYPIANIFIPLLVLGSGVALAVILPQGAGLTVTLVTFFGAILWWSILGRKVYEKQRDKKLQELKDSGFIPNHTFNADGCTLVVDMVHGQVALLFRWNPGKVYVRPASALSNVRVDDGRGGAGFMEGSSRVSFLFTVEGITIRVNTFTSNRRWRMDSDYILTGISKADKMVAVLEAAKSKAG